MTSTGTQHAAHGVLSPDQTTLYTGILPDQWHYGETVIAWEVAKLLGASTPSCQPAESEPVHHDSEVVAISPIEDGERVATVSRRGQVWLWEDGNPRPVWRRPPEDGLVSGFGVSADERYFGIETEVSQFAWSAEGRPVKYRSERRVAVHPVSPDSTEPLAAPPTVEINPCPYFPALDAPQLISPIPESDLEFFATRKGIAVRNRTREQLLAEFPLPNQVTIVRASRDRRVFVGDEHGWVWQFELRGEVRTPK